MSRIFALVSVATILLVGTAAIGSSVTESGSEAEALEDILAIFAVTLEIGALIPIILIAGLIIAALGVMGR